MGRLIVIFMSISFSAFTLPAAGQGFTCGEVGILPGGDSITVFINGFVPVKRGKMTLVFRPVLTDGENRWMLGTLVSRSGGQRRMAERKNGGSPGEVYPDAIFIRPGKPVDYSVRVAGQGWMEGSDLIMESYFLGCRDGQGPVISTLFSGVVTRTVELTDERETGEYADMLSPPVTVGKLLSMQYPFIKPSRDAEQGLHLVYDDERDQYMSIYFRQGRSTIEDEYMDNPSSLELLEGVVGALIDSEDSGINVISIVGFASPEGNFELNDRLAWSRGIAVKNRMVSMGIPSDIIQVHNGSEDWRGLRMMVENSVMDGKEQVLDIILNVPLQGGSGNPGRLERLRKLDGGRPYKYMLENFFPYLRNAAYIRVYYQEQI